MIRYFVVLVRMIPVHCLSSGLSAYFFRFQSHFSKQDLHIIKPFIDKSTIKICSYDYGKIYGIEAYILISKN